MMVKYKIFIAILILLASSRLLPHPPNFTSLIALSFYVPLIFGMSYIPIIILSFAFTDIFFGYHQTLFFTWGSVILIGFLSKYFFKTLIKRLCGAIIGSIVFYLITNFGVWLSGIYPFNLNGLILSYIAALPFFAYNIISTIIFSVIIEATCKFYKAIFKKSLVV